MSTFNPTVYGPVFELLLSTDRRRPLDAGRPNVAARAALRALTVETAFAHLADNGKRKPVTDFDMAACCISGVWLLYDYLDESHTLSQNIDTTSGSYWHGIMHRREGDFSNAKYWFRHVGRHPVLELLAEQVHVGESLRDSNQPVAESLRDSNQPALPGERHSQTKSLSLPVSEKPAYVGESLRDSQSRLGETRPHVWDPFAFVDECQAAVRGKSNGREQCLNVQQLEWELLFDYCFRAATGQRGD